jgi:hypothetical protein
MAIMNSLKGKFKEAQDVIDDFMDSSCCDEDEGSSKKINGGIKNGKKL